jgi:predicted MPP superfamily phosphohydrolase
MANSLIQPDVSVVSPGGWLQVGEPHGMRHVRYSLPVPGLPAALEGLKLLHVSDLHFRRRRHAAVEELLAAVTAAQADLLLITGDFVESKTRPHPAMPHVYEFLSRAASPHGSRLGTFGILGNHDRHHLTPLLAGQPVRLLQHETAVLRHLGATIEIVGLVGVDRRELDHGFVRTHPPKPAGALRIVLSHYPDVVRHVEPLGADLFLAGHTHAGQVRTPWGFAFLKHDSLPRRYCTGLHLWNMDGSTSMWMHTSPGWGFSALSIRLFCPPQLTEFILQPA